MFLKDEPIRMGIMRLSQWRIVKLAKKTEGEWLGGLEGSQYDVMMDILSENC